MKKRPGIAHFLKKKNEIEFVSYATICEQYLGKVKFIMAKTKWLPMTNINVQLAEMCCSKPT